MTSIETVTFDSPSANIDEWKRAVLLSLVDRTYDKRRDLTSPISSFFFR